MQVEIKEKGDNHKKITKTDYFIYLKQLRRKIQQFIKIHGKYFVYLNTQNNKSNNLRHSKSSSKYYPIKHQQLLK